MNNSLANHFYDFESIEATSLALIPLSIRYRLDCCAIKLHLRQWQRFTLTERAQLLRAPFATAADTQAWVVQLATVLQLRCDCSPDRFIDTTTPAWLQKDRWPAEIVDRCTQLALPLPALDSWQRLAAPHRHALCKIARSRHDYVHLPAALREMLSVDDPHHAN